MLIRVQHQVDLIARVTVDHHQFLGMELLMLSLWKRNTIVDLLMIEDYILYHKLHILHYSFLYLDKLKFVKRGVLLASHTLEVP